MTVEEIRVSLGVDESKNDQFPVGMRVLAVDDDLTCLRVLESLLRRCQYHVTTTNQAISALKMLRENKNKFDLVISDVHMPDMDGFKLLELVGLEMDLPVIMLSGNSDTRLVMKGINHGACDYLLKPVRIEELKNIWQHVVRRRKFDSKDQDIDDNPERSHSATENPNQNERLNRKRKEQNEEEDDEGDENPNENEIEDPSAQKKPRVVWSVELHGKFVAAVNQLGIDKAVPKKILDLMNIDGLSRENVASHLQKYRLYLKRLSGVESQQVNMVAAQGGKDSSYLGMDSLNRLRDFPTLSGPGQLPNTAPTSYPSGVMLGRLNTPTCLGTLGLASSGIIQVGHTQNSNNSVNSLGKLQQIVLPGNQNENLLQGMPTSLELDRLQQNKSISRFKEFSTPTGFSVASGFPNNGLTIGSSNNSFPNGPNHSLMLQGLQQQNSVRMASINSGSFETGVGANSYFPNQGRYNDNWRSAPPLTGYPSNPLLWSDHPSTHAELSPNNLRENISSTAPQIVSNPLDVFLNGVNVQQDNSKLSNFGSMSDCAGQNINYAPTKNREDYKQDFSHNSNLIFDSLNSSAPIHGVVSSLGQTLAQSNAVGIRKMNMNFTGQSNCQTLNLKQHNGIEKSSMDTTERLNEEYLLDQTKSQDGIISDRCGSLEDLMSSMIKQDTEMRIMDEDVESDVFPLRRCM